MPNHSIRTLMDFYRQKPVTNDNDVIVCDCGNSWLEVVKLEQFLKEHQVILGQRPPRKENYDFYMLRCPKCLKLHEPSVQFGGRDLGQQSYYDFLDQLTDNKETLDNKETVEEKE